MNSNISAHQSILDKMATLKPKMTIFEIKMKKQKVNTTETSNAAEVMRQMRQSNIDRIENFKNKKAQRISNMQEQIEKAKSDTYIPYRPVDDAAEKHLEINAFQKEATDAMMESGSKQQGNKAKKVS